jgi:DNA (cytosine-5)-methyltransferase 1
VLTLYDEFAGWGGSSQGAAAVPGVELVLAANHAPVAVEVHALNFPAADHYLGDITKADITRFPRTDLFWASPSCPPFSNGRGEKQYFDAATKLALFEDPGETPQERAKRLDLVKRRALMEEVPRYLRAMALRGEPVLAGVVENVPQARRWDQHDSWRRQIEAIGPYKTRLIALNAMHAQPLRTRRAPQSRDRYFLAYWLTKLGRDPDWDKWLRPRAYCPACDQAVNAVQVWKQPGQDMGGYGPSGQYVYWCPARTCRNRPIEPGVLPAASAIDWTLPPGERIGDRKRPLKPATLARIEAGLRRFAGRAITLEAGGHTFERRPGVRTWPLDAPLTTLTTTATRAIAAPPMLIPAGGTWRGEASPLDAPMPARTTRESDGLLIPVSQRAGQTSAYQASSPFRTQTARRETALAQPPAMVMRNNSSRGDGSEMSTSVDEPLRTLTTRGHQSLITWNNPRDRALMLPYYSNGTARPVTEPVGTLTTRDRYALVQPADLPAAEDCTFRMLAPTEIAAGMAFAADYRVRGTKREQVAGYGNAVCPPCSEVIISALVEAITGQDVTG